MQLRNALAAILVLLAELASAQDVGVLNLPPLHLTLPPTWSFEGSKRPIEGRGPDGEKVLISVVRRRPGVSSQSPTPALELASGFANGPMADLAAKGGKKVVRPVSELATAPGKAAFSAASEISGAFGRKSYFVQYLVAANDVMFYFTFEGSGEAASAVARFDEFFASQRWDE